MIVQYHPLTASDLNSAVSYYNRQRLGLGDEFRLEVYNSSENAGRSPSKMDSYCSPPFEPGGMFYRGISTPPAKVK
jgi:hypothetical protein